MKLKHILITLLILFGLGAAAVGGYFAYQKHQENNQPPKKETVSVEGEIVCLPHKNTDGLQTLECAAGLQTAEGKRYGLSTNGSAVPLSSAAGTKKRASVTGALEPAGDTLYDIQGVIVVEKYELR